MLLFRDRLPASTRLVFREPRTGRGSGAVAATLPRLRAGIAGRYRIHYGTGTVGAVLPRPYGVLAGRYVQGTGTTSARLPGMAGAIGGELYSRVWRGLVGGAGIAWGSPARLASSWVLPLGRADALTAAGRIGLDRAGQLNASRDLTMARAQQSATSWRVTFGPTSGRSIAAVTLPWAPAASLRAASRIDWGQTSSLGAAFSAPWEQTARLRSAVLAPWGVALPLATVIVAPWARSESSARRVDVVWRQGRAPAFGTRPPVPPVVPPGLRWAGDPHLVFRGRVPASTHLVFRRYRPLRALPLLEFYHVHNTAYCRRVSDDAELACRSIRISGDAQSWGRRFSGEAAYSERHLWDLSNGPFEIQIGANGVVWRASVQSVRPVRRFGADSLSWEAVSLAAELAAPYAVARNRSNTQTLTAQQIATAELDGTGWAMDWQIIDWSVPPGCFSVEESTPIDAIRRIAEAVGGIVQSHRTARILTVAPQYPVLPWHWDEAEADVVLAEDGCVSVASEFTRKPAYDGVYVSGQSHGVNALVIRDGAAGTNLAPMAVDALVCHVDANRARGEAILADTGAQSTETLLLPVPETLGVIEPGALVRVQGATSWTGIARSVDIEIAAGEDALAIWQIVRVERHYG